MAKRPKKPNKRISVYGGKDKHTSKHPPLKKPSLDRQEVVQFAEGSTAEHVQRRQGKQEPGGTRSGLVPQGSTRFTMNMREEVHIRLKIAAAKERRTMGELVEELVERHIAKMA